MEEKKKKVVVVVGYGNGGCFRFLNLDMFFCADKSV